MIIAIGIMGKFYLGIDIGGSKIKGVLLDKKKNQWFLGFNIATPKNKKKFLKVLEQEIYKLLQKKKIIGIGVGLPGIVDRKHGLLIRAPNLPFLNNWQARKFFSKFSKNLKFDNDSRCFVIAESVLGVGRKYRNIIGITIGTGIGGGIIIDGKIYYGAGNGAGEFGKMIINLQSQISNLKTFEQVGGKKAFLKYGDRSKIIGVGVANLINILDPQIVILGGGGITSGGVKIKTVQKIAKKYIMSPLAKKTPIVKGKLKDNSQAIGAALLFLR